MATWLAITTNEIHFDDVSGADVQNGVMRYVIQRREDGSFGPIRVDGREIVPASSMCYVAGSTLHVQVG